MKEGKEDTKKRVGNQKYSFRVHTQFHTHFICLKSNHSTRVNFKKCQEDLEEEEMSLIISCTSCQLLVASSSKYLHILRERHLYSCLSLIFIANPMTFPHMYLTD